MSETQRISVVADDPDDFGPLDEVSTLELLRERVAQTQAKDDVEWPVPRRDGVKIRYSVILTPEKIRKLLARNTNKRTGELDIDTYTAMILATQCTGILIDDVLVEDGGKPLTLHDKAIIDLFGATRAVEAVRCCYGATPEQPDGYALDVQNHANALIAAAGFGEVPGGAEEDEEDPPDR